MTERLESLTVELMGPVCARLNGVEIKLGAPRQRALFAVLAMRANAVVSRSELIDAVWGDRVPASIESNLYTYISSLRQALEPHRPTGSRKDQLLVSLGSGYSLRLPRANVDVHVFIELRDSAQERKAAGDYEHELKMLNSALELWHGEALSGLPGSYAATQRNLLHDLRLSMQERRCEIRLAKGTHSEVVAELSELINDEPLRESLRCLQMLALYRSGRIVEALEVFRAARQLLTEEIGIEPGPEMQSLHQKILSRDAALNLEARIEVSPPQLPLPRFEPLRVVPSHVANGWASGPVTLLGRDDEVAALQRFVAELASGHGRAVWIEGDSGIGKSALLTVGLAGAQTTGCHITWAVADELSQRFPLHVILESLGNQAVTPDPRLAQLAKNLLEPEAIPRHWDPTNPTLAAIDRLLTFIGDLCTECPLMLVIDDVQWADETSLLVWHRLVGLTQRLPLLLVAASRLAARRVELAQLRNSLEARGASVISLGALSSEHTNQLMSNILGALPGPGLIRLAERAAGNPLYLREMIDSVLLAGHLDVKHGAVDVDAASGYQAPLSLIAALRRRLGPLSAGAREVLRVAAVLGGEFAVADVALILGRPSSSLLDSIDEAVEATVLVEAGARLAFRHPLLRQALYDGISVAMRVALQREAAEALAGAGAPIDRVAQLLVMEPVTIDGWLVAWLTGHRSELISRAPAVALELFQQTLTKAELDAGSWEELTAGLGSVLFRLGANPESPARRVLAQTVDPQRAAEMRFLLASALYRGGNPESAVQTLREATQDPRVPDTWRARLQALLAGYLCSGLQDLEAADVNARQAIAMAEHAHDPLAGADGLQTLWQINAVRRDHGKSLEYVDRAIALVRDEPDLIDLHFNLLDTRMFCLQNLDRLAEATATLNTATELAAKCQVPSGLEVPAAVHYYWTGEWDQALAQLAAVVEEGPALTYGGFRERSAAMLLMHGIAALIAVHRDDEVSVHRHLTAADSYPLRLSADRANCDFLLMAQSLAAERRGQPTDALTVVEPILDTRFAPMMLRHQWLPEVVRIALSVGDHNRARSALDVSESEASTETVPARAFTASQRCRGLLTNDPDLLLAAAGRYRDVGRVVELALTLEDAAVCLVNVDRRAAWAALDEALDLYAALGAQWDQRRSRARIESIGIRPVAGRRPSLDRPSLDRPSLDRASLDRASQPKTPGPVRCRRDVLISDTEWHRRHL
ncbi:MAG: hypothetical protein JWN95_3650 [Frankiales bacterium]|nr:hypothetical protein [Frankiales bacterium]